MNKDQISFNFDQPPPEPARKVEVYEQDECPACGNIIESDSPGCFQCRGNKDKLRYQKRKDKTQ
jgi:tRNA(Ile2) C34 agmatinyltransferase TiaS